MCIAQGFPALPFLVNEDLTRRDGAIVCRKLTALDTAKLGWRALRLLKLLIDFPVEF